MSESPAPLRLTQSVQKGGCAAKVPAMVLRQILAGLKFPAKPANLIIDGSTFDDAAIYQMNSQQALVQTLDFFTPIVDTAEIFGAVATANALSDVYAMGGRPLTAMAILAYPLSTFEPQLITELLQGACKVLSLASCPLVGGHSIDDETLKFGLSVTGQVHPDQVWSNQGAKNGDVLILTKAIGTGTLCAGLKRQTYTEADIEDALASMQQLNNVVDFLNAKEIACIHGATDITGFGLSGHSMQMAKASSKTLELNFAQIPLLAKALSSIDAGHMTRAHRTNAEYTQATFKIENSQLRECEQKILHDPQTSGGLLLSVQADMAHDLVAKLKTQFPYVAIVGSVQAYAGCDVRVV